MVYVFSYCFLFVFIKALVAGIDNRRPEEERRMCLKALGNAGIHYKNTSYNLLEEIQRIAEDKDQNDLARNNPEIKSQAIYSLRRISSKRPEEVIKGVLEEESGREGS